MKIDMYKNSIKAYKKSSDLIPGGVNSPVRAFKSVNCDPVFFKGAKEASYMMSMGTSILIVCLHGVL